VQVSIIYVYSATDINSQLIILYCDTDVLFVIVKYFILVGWGVLSTFSVVVVILFSFGEIGCVDIIINVICVILMNKLNAKYYDKYCKCCHKMVSICCIGIIENRKRNRVVNDTSQHKE